MAAAYPNRLYRFGEFTLSTLARELRRGGGAIPLSPRAFDALVYLLEHRDRAVSKDELVTAIWGRPNVSDTQLGQAVLRARRAVGDDGQVQNVIRTVSRYGYQWIAEVEIVESEETTDAPAVAPPIPLRTDEVDPVPPLAPSPTPRAGRSRRLRLAALSIACVLLILGAALTLRHFLDAGGSVAATASANAIVLPLQVDGGSDNAWLRFGAMDLIADRLRAAGETVPPSEDVVALVQTTRSGDGSIDAAAVRRTAPTALLVAGQFQQHKDAWTIALRATAADGTALEVESSQPDPLEAAREVADRLIARLGRKPPPEPAGGTGLQQRLQRAQAALLANDLDNARAILISDPQLARTEPQLGYRLAQVDFRAGEYVRAEAALTALLTEPAAEEPLFRARLLNALGAVQIRRDDITAAERNYDAAVALLRAGSHPAELGLALTGRGVTRSLRRAFAPALADLGEARVQLETAGDALGVARVDSNLGGLEMTRDRPEQALGYLENAAQRFETYGAINELMETLESMVSDNLALLRPRDALAASDRSWTLNARVTDPNQRLNLVLDRVDVFLALGRLREAGELLGGLPAQVPTANRFLARRLPTLRARLALLEARNQDAAAMAQSALDLRGPADDIGEGVAEIALTLQRAVLAQGAPPAQEPAQRWVASDAALAYPVQGLLKAEWAVANARDDVAAREYAAALDLAEQHGVPADVALVSASYGPWLLSQGRLEQATEVIGRVSPWAGRSFDCALLQVRLYHALGKADAWASALNGAQALAGERAIPEPVSKPPLSKPPR